MSRRVVPALTLSDADPAVAAGTAEHALTTVAHTSPVPAPVKCVGCDVARYRASERVVYRPGPRGNMWTASAGARGLLRKQLEAYESPGIIASRLRVGCNCLETVALYSHLTVFGTKSYTDIRKKWRGVDGFAIDFSACML